ncbi:ephrin-B2 [Pangasianodon hypophthalmus]|uniref:ephrin-B2 n=1 Tax=Pangasianodon hypophthalmus TaxID=310915 RepID=UPI002307E919|nr:ephrin-B2 [Pangasianodon hypophthalmus]
MRSSSGFFCRMERGAQKLSECPHGLTFLVIFLMESLTVTAANLEPIYWNSLNSRFGDERGYVLYPQMGDRLDLVCPASPSLPQYEFYKLYLVSKREQADRCELSEDSNLLLTCDKPNADTRFTIKFQEFSPNLWGHEFKNLHDYYIIATSDGTKQGLDSMRGGACATRGMKVVLKVGQSAYGLPPKPKLDSGRSSSKTPDHDTDSPNSVNGAEAGEMDTGDGSVSSSITVVIFSAVGGAFVLLLVAVVIGVVCYRRRKAKHSETQRPSLSLSALTPRRGGANTAGNAGVIAGGNMTGGTEPSDIIIPLRTSDSAYCPHYEKVSGDYGHPVYIVQEMPPQNPANIYYKV